MQNKECQAGTEVQQSNAADVTTSSSHNAKPLVVRSQSPNEIEQTENYIMLLEWLSLIGWLLVIVLIFG